MEKRSGLPDNKWELIFTASKGGHQNTNVNDMFKYGIEVVNDFDYWLKMDDDLVPDDDLIDRLLAVKADFVGAPIAIWRESHNPPAFVAIYNINKDGKYVQPELIKYPVGKCDYVGGGCIMISRGLCQRLYDEHKKTNLPIWQYYHPFEGQFVGSDELLCKELRSWGVDVYYEASYVIPQHTDMLVAMNLSEEGMKVDLSYANYPKPKPIKTKKWWQFWKR